MFEGKSQALIPSSIAVGVAICIFASMIKCLKLRVATTQFPISSLVLKLYESNPTRVINLVKWEVLGIPKRS